LNRNVALGLNVDAVLRPVAEERPEARSELGVRQRGFVDVDAVGGNRHHGAALRLQRRTVSLRERDFDASRHHGRRNHEDHEQQHHHIDEADYVDLRIEFGARVSAAQTHNLPSLAIKPITSDPKPSTRPAILFRRFAKMLYPKTAGMATASAAAVAMRA